MESHPRAATSPAGLRPLGLPRPVPVRTDDYGLPVAVGHIVRGRTAPNTWRAVAQVEEVWRVAEEWWRAEPLRRTYVRALFDNGGVVTLFHDDTQPPDAGWYEQHY